MSELKPCPFCGIDPGRIGEHKSECYFRRNTDSDGECDVKWNIRPLEDTLRAQLDVAVKAMANMELILSDGDERENINAPGDKLVEALCEREGYGFVMDSAARLWARKDNNAAFVCGPTRYMLFDARKQMRNALAEIAKLGEKK